MYKKSVTNIALIGGVVLLISGCAPRPHLPETTVFSNGATYHPTWDGYKTCQSYSDRSYAECKNDENGPVIATLYPDVDATIADFIKNYSSIDNLCNYANRMRLLRTRSACEDKVRDQLLRAGNDTKAYNWGLIDQKTYLIKQGKILEAYKTGVIDKDTARDGLLTSGLVLEAYQEGLIDKKTYLVKANSLGKIDKKTYFLEAYKEKLIDKDTARSGLLDAGYVLEAYQAKLIDKDTANLYLQKQANDKAAYEAGKRSKEQLELAKRQADAAEKQARAAEDQVSQMRYNQDYNSLQQTVNRLQDYNQLNNMIQQNNINNNMRKYY